MTASKAVFNDNSAGERASGHLVPRHERVNKHRFCPFLRMDVSAPSFVVSDLQYRVEPYVELLLIQPLRS